MNKFVVKCKKNCILLFVWLEECIWGNEFEWIVCGW